MKKPENFTGVEIIRRMIWAFPRSSIYIPAANNLPEGFCESVFIHVPKVVPKHFMDMVLNTAGKFEKIRAVSICIWKNDKAAIRLYLAPYPLKNEADRNNFAYMVFVLSCYLAQYQHVKFLTTNRLSYLYHNLLDVKNKDETWENSFKRRKDKIHRVCLKCMTNVKDLYKPYYPEVTLSMSPDRKEQIYIMFFNENDIEFTLYNMKLQTILKGIPIIFQRGGENQCYFLRRDEHATDLINNRAINVPLLTWKEASDVISEQLKE